MPAVTAAGIDDLRVLYDLHGAEIFRFCSRLVGDRGLAEEAVQETFLRAWRARDRWEENLGSVRTWLYSIARNVSIDLLRARSVRPQLNRFGAGGHNGRADSLLVAQVVDVRRRRFDLRIGEIHASATGAHRVLVC